MIGYRKKKGFTITELIIVVALTVVVLGIIWTMFNISNKIISDVTIKSELQREGQAIQEKLSNIGMQAVGIKSVIKDDSKKTITIEINSYYKSESSDNPFYFRYDYKDVANKKLYLNYSADSSNKDEDYKLVSDNVNSIEINSEDITTVDENTLKNVNCAEFTIKLSKKKTYKNEKIDHEIKVRTVFRNKNILN